jgi:ATP-dependent protease ClpP protease subunit
MSKHDPTDEPEGPLEIYLHGDLTEKEGDICDNLLGVPPGGECYLYFNSPGGSSYAALSLMSLITLRGIQATGIVTGECSSAALWPLAACRRRYVTAHSVLLFHPMKWESEEHVGIAEAGEWARHFIHLEEELDTLLARYLGVPAETLAPWIRPGRYVTGREFAAAGFAELIELAPLAPLFPPMEKAASRSKKK